MNKVKRLFSLAAFTSALVLVGCGGGDDESNGGNNVVIPQTPMLAMDGFSVVKPNSDTHIDLSQYIRGSDVRISGVKEDVDNLLCGDPTINGLGINVNIEKGTFCHFTYTATQSGMPEARVNLNVLATEASDAMLPPISRALVLPPSNNVEQIEPFDLPALLVGVWKDTYTLNFESVNVHGMDGNLGEAVGAENNVINYTLPESSGWNRIVFTLDDSAAPTESVMGVIYVTLSAESNGAPTIGNDKYDYNAAYPEDSVFMDDEITLNLFTLSGLDIVEPDEEDWQLVDVRSFTATVKATNPDSITNTSFDFTAPTVGDHYVSYIIADWNGGYTPGLIKITTSIKAGDDVDWSDITTSGNTYIAPQTYEQASESYNVSALWDTGVTHTIAGYNSTSANNYCRTVGSLPTVTDLNTLRNERSTDELNKWPKEKLYLATQSTDFKGYNLNTGIVSDYSSATRYYTTCVKSRSMTLAMLSDTVVADGELHRVANVAMPTPADSFSLTRVDGTAPTTNLHIENVAKFGSVTEVGVSNTKVGTLRFKVTDNDDLTNELTSQVVNFVADKATGHLSASIKNNGQLSNGTRAVLVSYHLKDENGNPLGLENIKIASEDKSDITWSCIPTGCETLDADGDVEVSVFSSTPGDFTLTANWGDKSSDAEVSFSSSLAGPIIDLFDRGGGKLFTNSPSVAYLDSIGGSVTNSVFSETGYSGPAGDFYRFNWDNANTLCTTYNTHSLGGRTNWHLPEVGELTALSDDFGWLYPVRGWPSGHLHWTATPSGSGYNGVGLSTGSVTTGGTYNSVYVSCVSDPEG
ncbi:DUF1566 domain-containing protein [Vibrio sp. OPT18]|uniref:DUF1566 domain-containing protein n=1 Tax=Vibrio sp. OPT18 TaxID=2778641 RepID=UPI00187F3CBE|nr:DUF1566 domain-containing protein [Vibrio sp. OPT18]MBE8574169.1 DUF1566 domain-containing protein [Vibrio sp. OPT18]